MSQFATSTGGRIALGLGTFGASEGFGLRPLAQAITGKDPLTYLTGAKTKFPQPPAAQGTPTTDSPAVQQAAAGAAGQAANRRGFASTILSLMTQRTAGPRTTLGS